MSDTKVIKTQRNANGELLRLLCMAMIIVLHALDKGNNLRNMYSEMHLVPVVAWLLESLSIVAVNAFLLLSGYYLSKSSFKLGRLIELILQTLFYTILPFGIAFAFNFTGEKLDLYNIFRSVLPVHMDVYWFITCYIALYMLSPLINRGIRNMNKAQFGSLIIILLIFESLLKSFSPISLTMDESGYNVLWCLIVYLIGAYFRLYGFKHLTNVKKSVALYLSGSFVVFLEMFVLMFITGKFGKLDTITARMMPRDYNNIFVLAASVGIFAAFMNKKPMKEKCAAVVCALSPMALGIYLLHETVVFRYEWPKWLGIVNMVDDNIISFFIGLIIAVVCVFAVGLAIDFVRIKLFNLIRKPLSKLKLSEKILSFDRMING